MYLSSLWVKVFEWWAGQSSATRYLIALVFLGFAAIAWIATGRILILGLSIGFVLLIAAMVVRD